MSGLPEKEALNAFLPEGIPISMDDYPFSLSEFSTKSYLVGGFNKRIASLFSSGSNPSKTTSVELKKSDATARPRLSRSMSELNVKQTKW